MDRYALDNAAGQVDGYYLPRESDLSDKQLRAFNRAQAECAAALAARLADVQVMTFEQFMTATKRSKQLVNA